MIHGVIGNAIVELILEDREPVDCEVVIPVDIIPRNPDEAVEEAVAASLSNGRSLPPCLRDCRGEKRTCVTGRFLAQHRERVAPALARCSWALSVFKQTSRRIAGSSASLEIPHHTGDGAVLRHRHDRRQRNSLATCLGDEA